MRQERVLARFLAASLSFRFVTLKVDTMTFPFMASSVTQGPLAIGPLGSEAWPGWWRQHVVAEPEAESPSSTQPQSWPGPFTLTRAGSPLRSSCIFKKKKLFIWLHRVLAAAPRSSLCEDLSLQHTDRQVGETLYLETEDPYSFLPALIWKSLATVEQAPCSGK